MLLKHQMLLLFLLMLSYWKKHTFYFSYYKEPMLIEGSKIEAVPLIEYNTITFYVTMEASFTSRQKMRTKTGMHG